MGSSCCENKNFDGTSEKYRRVLIAVIVINAAMFFVEIIAGFTAQSMALQADALDFAGDALTTTISLLVIGQALALRAKAALMKGLILGGMGVWVLGATAYRVIFVGMPDEVTMGTIGFLALAANVLSMVLLMNFREGDANVRAVWLCARNDAIGNVMVMVGALLVAWTATPWPDLIIAAVLATIFVSGAWQIIRQSRAELLSAKVPVSHAH